MQRQFQEPNGVYLYHKTNEVNSISFSAFHNILKQSGVDSTQINLLENFRSCLIDATKLITLPTTSSLKRRLSSYNSDYIVFERLFKNLNMTSTDRILKFMKYIDSVIISKHFILTKKIKTCESEVNYMNIVDYIKLRLKRLNLTINDQAINLLVAYIARHKKLKNKMKMISSMFELFIKSENFKQCYDYCAYSELKKVKLIIICENNNDQITDIEYNKLINLKKQIFIVNLNSSFHLINLKNKDFIEKNSNIKVYDISRHKFVSYRGHLTRYLLYDVQKQCGLQKKVNK